MSPYVFLLRYAQSWEAIALRRSEIKLEFLNFHQVKVKANAPMLIELKLKLFIHT